MLKSKIIKRSAKMQIYKTLIRPAVTSGSETRTLTKSDENLLIYGPIREGDIWRSGNDEELNRYKNGEDILKLIRARRIRYKENGSGSDDKKGDGRNTSSLLHRAFRRITLIINQQMFYIKFHIKILKIAPTCFDPKIILRELRFSLLKSF